MKRFAYVIITIFHIIVIKAIALRSSIKSMSAQRESQQQQLLALISEKQLTLERYSALEMVLFSLDIREDINA